LVFSVSGLPNRNQTEPAGFLKILIGLIGFFSRFGFFGYFFSGFLGLIGFLVFLLTPTPTHLKPLVSCRRVNFTDKITDEPREFQRVVH